MPRIRHVVTMSLDGYIAGPQGEVDGLSVSPPSIGVPCRVETPPPHF